MLPKLSTYKTTLNSTQPRVLSKLIPLFSPLNLPRAKTHEHCYQLWLLLPQGQQSVLQITTTCHWLSHQTTLVTAMVKFSRKVALLMILIVLVSSIMAKWDLITQEDYPVMESHNQDYTIKPPTECNAPINPKYGFNEIFKCKKITGTGTYAKMICKRKQNAIGGRNRKSKFSPTRKGKFHKDLGKKQVFGGPNEDYSKCSELNQHSHPMDWVNTLLPMTLAENSKGVWGSNMKGNNTSKFISNWTTYTTTKAMMCNAGKEGRIYDL